MSPRKRVTPTESSSPFILAATSRAVSDHEADLPGRDAGMGQLIVFVNGGAAGVEPEFARKHLPRIRALTEETGVGLRVLDVRDGAPSEVTVTPLLVYQGHHGRSVYLGRYTTLSRIRTFLRTGRMVAQKLLTRKVQRVPLWKTGRANIIAPIKITVLAGTRPEGYEPSPTKARSRYSAASRDSK